MSSELDVRDDVKELIAEIAEKYNPGRVTEVKYYPGTELGDGYSSKHVAVDIVGENGTLKLFVKYSLNFEAKGNLQFDQVYENEAYFYEEIYPAYSQFLREKGLPKGLEYVAECFGSSIKNIIVLDNVKAKGYGLFDRMKMMNDSHIFMVLKTYAKFHAISFAFKDQRPAEYDKLAKRVQDDIWGVKREGAPMMKVFREMTQAALDKLDPEMDKSIIEKCTVELLTKNAANLAKELDEYSIITKGDCWCNNIMFLYEDDDKENPIDVILVDWQMMQCASVIYDVSYVLFTVASPEVISKIDSYLDLYYSTLTDCIRKLGSDPNILYPRPVFEKEWKQNCRYGLAMAFLILRIMLINKDEVTKFEEIDFERSENFNMFPKFRNEGEYIRRIRMLSEFCISNGYI